MTDPRRSDRPPAAADPQERERDARVEELLLAGLDHYFAGQHELAISVWTRVLFLNHGHARARAYIVRARSAISERQRENEELVHSGLEAFSRGNAQDARRLLAAALERGVGNDEALSLLDRLNRCESTGAAHVRGVAPLEPRPGAPVAAAGKAQEAVPSRTRWVAAGLAAGAVVAIAVAALWIPGTEAWLVQATAPPPAALVDGAEPLPLPAAGETSLARARALQAKGRLHEALATLDAVQHGDDAWADAQTLRVVIQRQLLKGSGSPLSLPETRGAARVARP